MPKEKDLPWQNYPEKFIRYASNFENTKDDFERLIGYLLLDVGVESLFKAFVLADTSLKYSEREASAKGSVAKDTIGDSKITAVNFEKITFHNLLETVKLAAKAKVTDEELKNAEHFHGIRNIIYHEGRKTIPSEQDFKNYLNLGKSFLQKLLGVSEDQKLMSELTELTIEGRMEYVGREIGLSMAPIYMQEIFPNLRLSIAVAAEAFASKYTSKRLEKSLNKIKQSFPDNEGDSVSSRYASQMQRITSFKELMGNEIEEDIDFIDEVLDDITYLYLDILLSLNIVGDNDIDNYRKYCYFFERFQNHPDYASREDKERMLHLQDWAKGIEEMLDIVIAKQISNNQKGEDK